MALPKEPRQKMINIMYLVLTALLALNVSAEILNAFKTVDRSLTYATQMADNKTSNVFKSFQEKLNDGKTNKDTAQKYYGLAQKAQTMADNLVNYINSLKTELMQESGLKTVDGKPEYKEDDLEASTRLFVSNPPDGKGKGQQLFQALAKFKTDLLNLDSSFKEQYANSLPLDLTVPKSGTGSTNNDWSYGYFHMTPSVASITMLSKFQNDIRNSEGQAVEFFHKKIGEVKVVYDEFQAFAGQNSQYLMPGEELVITAGVGAFSTRAKPTITIDGAGVQLKPDGSGEYRTRVGNSGPGSKKVHISFFKPDGTQTFRDVEVKYVVGVPSGLVVSTDKTRVFYQGLENPLNVTGGSGDEKVSVTVEGPGVTSRKAGAGQYIVTCEKLGSATVVATDGKNTQRITIPIKRVPDPKAKVGGKAGGPQPANQFRVQRGVAADLEDFVFEGVKYEVVSFTLICTGKGFEESGLVVAECTGPYFSAEAQGYIRRCQPGSTVVIDEIKVRGPGGVRTLDQNISFTLQ